MTTTENTTPRAGDIVSYKGRWVGILRPAPVKYRGMPIPAGWVAFHRYVATRDDFAKTHTTLLDPADNALAPAADPRTSA